LIDYNNFYVLCLANRKNNFRPKPK
jgi:hypothetical protein